MAKVYAGRPHLGPPTPLSLVWSGASGIRVLECIRSKGRRPTPFKGGGARGRPAGLIVATRHSSSARVPSPPTRARAPASL